MNLRALLLTLLPERATVYTADADGRYTTLATSSLPCRAVLVVRRADMVTIDRAELLSQRTLYFDPDYELDERAQIDLDGVRWNPIPGSFTAPKDLGGVVAYRACTIGRAA
jgi:hypothetical protein